MISINKTITTTICAVLLSVVLPTAAHANREPDHADTPQGLNYSYYEVQTYYLPDFDSLTPELQGYSDNFDIAIRNESNHFAYKFEGYVTVPTDGEYTFYLKSDDGSKLYIGNTEVVDNDGKHAKREESGTIGLQQGMHQIEVTYFDHTGGEILEVYYEGPDIAKTQIPDSALNRLYDLDLREPDNPEGTEAGLYYQYYEETAYVLPDFDTITPVKTGYLTNYSLDPAERYNEFQFQFNGYIKIEHEGVYTFYTESDDGSKLYIGDTEVVNNDQTHGTRERSGEIGLEEGYHEITVTYFEWVGGEVLEVYYEGPGIEKGAIPSSALFQNVPEESVVEYGEDDEDDSEEEAEEETDDDTEPEVIVETETEVIYVDTPSVCTEPIRSIKGMTNGRIKIAFSNGDIAKYKVFNITSKKKPKVQSYDNSSYVVALGPSGRILKMVNACTGEIEDTIRVAKKKQKHNSLKMRDLRYDGSTEVVVTSTKGKYTRVSIVRVNKKNKEFSKKSQDRFYSEANVTARKTKRRKRDGIHKLLVRDIDANVVRTYHVTKDYNLTVLE